MEDLPPWFDVHTSIRTTETNAASIMQTILRGLEVAGAQIDGVQPYTICASVIADPDWRNWPVANEVDVEMEDEKTERYNHIAVDEVLDCTFETHLFDNDEYRIVEFQRRRGDIMVRFFFRCNV